MACVLSSNVNDDTKTTPTFLYVYDHKEWSENLRYESDCNTRNCHMNSKKDRQISFRCLTDPQSRINNTKGEERRRSIYNMKKKKEALY